MGCGPDVSRKQGLVRVKREAEEESPVVTYKRRRVANPSPDIREHCINMVTYNRNFEQDEHDRTTGHWSSWKDTLENLLQSPHISEGGGIHRCICDALKYNPCRSVVQVKNGVIQSGSSKLQDSTDEGRGDAKKQPRLHDSNVADPSIALGNGASASLDANNAICNNVLLHILVSEKFALLCDLLHRNFYGNKTKTVVNFDRIDAKMKNGDYAHSPQSFDHDIQQIWVKFEEVGREMMDLASSLSIMSQASHQKQACGVSEVEVAEHKTEETSLVGVAHKCPKDSTTTMQLTPCMSGDSTKPNKTEADGLYKICTCNHCGTKADGQGSLICDGCEAMYHFSCIKPSVKEIPTQNWYCSGCSTKGKESARDIVNHICRDSLHDNCAVCDRLDISNPVELPELGSRAELADDAQGSSVSSMVEDEKPDLSTTALSRLCKHCGTCEDDDKKFLICDHEYCPYKFYHIRCLKTSQIASMGQQKKTRWYCPSCLCRCCYMDKDDDQIVLCDGCDEAYHMYCMKPPRTSIPKGQWYCISCSVERARQGMRKYEQSILQRHRNVKCFSDAKDSTVSLRDGPKK